MQVLLNVNVRREGWHTGQTTRLRSCSSLATILPSRVRTQSQLYRFPEKGQLVVDHQLVMAAGKPTVRHDRDRHIWLTIQPRPLNVHSDLELMPYGYSLSRQGRSTS